MEFTCNVFPVYIVEMNNDTDRTIWLFLVGMEIVIETSPKNSEERVLGRRLEVDVFGLERVPAEKCFLGERQSNYIKINSFFATQLQQAHWQEQQRLKYKKKKSRIDKGYTFKTID